MHKKPSILRSLLSIVPFFGRGQELIQQQHGNVAAKKVTGRKRKAKGGRYGRTPYRPGKLGLSAVSTAIKKDYGGAILSRRERREYARKYRGFGATFKAYYN